MHFIFLAALKELCCLAAQKCLTNDLVIFKSSLLPGGGGHGLFALQARRKLLFLNENRN